MCRSPNKLKSLNDVPYLVDVKVHVLSFNMILSSSPQRVPTPSYSFRVKLGDQVEGRSQRKLKSLIEVPYVAHLKVQVLSFNKNLIFSPQRVLRPSYPCQKNLGDQVKDRSPKKIKLLTEVPYVAHLKVQVLIFNMNLFSSPQRVPRPSQPFREKLGRSWKMLFTEKARIVDRGFQSCALQSTGCKLHHELYLSSVACSQTNLSISVKIWEIR